MCGDQVQRELQANINQKVREQVEAKTNEIPKDSYSFIAEYGPETCLCAYFIGLLVCVFQIFGLILIIQSQMSTRWNEKEGMDNPLEHDSFGIPANESGIVITAQFYAIAIFVFSYGATFVDVFESFRVLTTPSENNNMHRRVASFLRIAQATFATVVVLILGTYSSNVVIIILNISAINTISELDERVFAASLKGWLGSTMEIEATKIQRKVPAEAIADQKTIVYKATLCSTLWIILIQLALVLGILNQQRRATIWTTQIFRLQFEDSSNLQKYNGCYERVTGGSKPHRRHVYQSINDTVNNGFFKYCRPKRNWVFLKDDTDPCQNDPQYEILHSDETYAFDIHTAFTDSSWSDPWGKAVDYHLVGHEWKSSDEEKFFCNETIGDGKCDEFLNEFSFDFDGGDCCPTTCNNGECTMEVDDIFGTKGLGFPRCKDTRDIDANLDITLEKFEVKDLENSPYFNFSDPSYSNRFDESLLSIDVTLECDNKTVFSVDGVRSKDEYDVKSITIVEKGLNCSLNVNTFEPLFNVIINHTSGPDSGIKVENKTTNIIPTAIGTMIELSIISLSNLSLVGTIPTEISSNGELMTELDLSQNRITGTIPTQLGELKNLTKLNLGDNRLNGTIPTEVFSNYSKINLVTLDLRGNALTGTIPDDIKMSENLEFLNLADNHLTGKIPDWIGDLAELKRLDFSGNELIGAIPTEIGTLEKLTFIDLGGNIGLRGDVDCKKFSYPASNDTDCANIEEIRQFDTEAPTGLPSVSPSFSPSKEASELPSVSVSPSTSPSAEASEEPSVSAPPSTIPSAAPTPAPSVSVSPSTLPSEEPSEEPSVSFYPSTIPSAAPTPAPSVSVSPSTLPSEEPSEEPSVSFYPSTLPSAAPTPAPSLSSKPSPLPSTSPTSESVFEILCSNDELTEMCRIAEGSPKQDSLLSQNLTWTVFAFTDAGFQSLRANYTGINTTIEQKLFDYHIVRGRRLMKEDLPCVAGENTIEMLSGEDSRTRCLENKAYGQKGPRNQDPVQFQTFDLEAVNGVVHIIDGILLYKDFEGDVSTKQPITSASTLPLDEGDWPF